MVGRVFWLNFGSFMFGSYEASRLVLHRVSPDNRINPKSKKPDWSRLQIFILPSFIGSERIPGFLFFLYSLQRSGMRNSFLPVYRNVADFRCFFFDFNFRSGADFIFLDFCKILQRSGFRRHQIRRNKADSD